MTDRELMQRALDAMLNNPDDISDEMFEAIRALKARLAQPEQEPVAWRKHYENSGYTYYDARWKNIPEDAEPLYL